MWICNSIELLTISSSSYPSRYEYCHVDQSLVILWRSHSNRIPLCASWTQIFDGDMFWKRRIWDYTIRFPSVRMMGEDFQSLNYRYLFSLIALVVSFWSNFQTTKPETTVSRTICGLILRHDWLEQCRKFLLFQKDNGRNVMFLLPADGLSETVVSYLFVPIPLLAYHSNHILFGRVGCI